MAVRGLITSAGNRLYLGGGGGSLAGWGMMVLINPQTLTGTQAYIGATETGGTTLGVLYYDATNELSMGSTGGDSHTTAFTLTATDWWLLGFSKAAGTSTIRFHAANITTSGAAAHANATATKADEAGTWQQTEIGSADAGAFQSSEKWFATAAVFTSTYADADFDAVVSAKSTQSIGNLSPARLWDFNQASTATAVTNLMTGSADETNDISSFVVTANDPPGWTFGYTAGATWPPADNPAAPPLRLSRSNLRIG